MYGREAGERLEGGSHKVKDRGVALDWQTRLRSGSQKRAICMDSKKGSDVGL